MTDYINEPLGDNASTVYTLLRTRASLASWLTRHYCDVRATVSYEHGRARRSWTVTDHDPG